MSERKNRQGASEAGAVDVCVRLARAFADITRYVDARLSNIHGIGFSDFMMLYHLERAPGQRLRRMDLAEQMGLSASAVTRALLPLEKIGMVARESDPRDARVGFATLTKAGARVLAEARATAQVACEDVLGQVRMDWDALGRFSAQR
ncbi:MarR family winged helix-turn-helix transcriptional regulator [Cupriavidus sp. AU9028]|uniref:MarR family winged helix-turn-helix transcriptional regulator n=1 Tax=Cupriavidus sp. AU9028 TaxID=2871157 RepID=UPI001C95601F|nr:MarR family transcriptional regulator [Cupriavidus sp. AU9028]MBY4897861.1 MarR family transcriptional regulator [Cupriavidus sp. AU9028]